MDFEHIKDILFREAEKQGLKEYDVYATTYTDLSVDVLEHEVNACSSGTGGGITFRCAVNGKLGAASTETAEEKELPLLVTRAIANAAVVDNDVPPIFFEGAADYRKTTAAVPALPSVAEMRGAALGIQERIYAASPLVATGTSASVGANTVSRFLANSKGVSLTHEAGSLFSAAEAILKDESEPTDAFAFCLGIDGEGIAEKAVAEALAKRGAKGVPTGTYRVIFHARQMRTMLSAYAGIFSGKNALEGLSRLAGKVGEPIAAPCVTLTDDPFYPENPMQVPFDAEGVPTVTKPLIEGGVLKTLLYDLTTAAKAGTKTTGNAVRGSYASPVSISSYCLCLAGGQDSPEALRARMGNGLYITEMKGLHAGANAITGDFSIESAGFLVENGEIARPVRGFTVAGNFYELLKSVEALADNVEMGYPGVSTVASPDVLVRGLSVAGEN